MGRPIETLTDPLRARLEAWGFITKEGNLTELGEKGGLYPVGKSLRLAEPLWDRLQASQSKRFTTMDGHRVASRAEVMIDDWLSSQGYAHEYEKPLPFGGKRPYRCDFYLPKEDIYLEYFGLRDEAYNRRRKEKEEGYQQHGLTLFSLEEEDLTNLSKSFFWKFRLWADGKKAGIY